MLIHKRCGRSGRRLPLVQSSRRTSGPAGALPVLVSFQYCTCECFPFPLHFWLVGNSQSHVWFHLGDTAQSAHQYLVPTFSFFLFWQVWFMGCSDAFLVLESLIRSSTSSRNHGCTGRGESLVSVTIGIGMAQMYSSSNYGPNQAGFIRRITAITSFVQRTHCNSIRTASWTFRRVFSRRGRHNFRSQRGGPSRKLVAIILKRTLYI